MMTGTNLQYVDPISEQNRGRHFCKISQYICYQLHNQWGWANLLTRNI